MSIFIVWIIVRKNNPIQVLFEDDQVIAFYKPANLVVIPTPKKETRTLTSIVNQQYISKDTSSKLHPCHRLDKDTTGVILYAKGKRTQQRMMEAFKEREVKKKYIAFVHGKLDNKKGKLTRNVAINQRRQNKPQEAITHYAVIEEKRQYSVVSVEPITGRTNQIRIHFKQLKHPLVGDRKFAFGKDYQLKFKRAALHASEVSWKNPLSGKACCAKADLAKDMEEFRNRNK